MEVGLRVHVVTHKEKLQAFSKILYS
jgi:hypothetical protein